MEIFLNLCKNNFLFLFIDSLQQLEDKIKRKRIRVPKLNQSTLDSSASSVNLTSVGAEVNSNIITEKRKRKVHSNYINVNCT